MFGVYRRSKGPTSASFKGMGSKVPWVPSGDLEGIRVLGFKALRFQAWGLGV